MSDSNIVGIKSLFKVIRYGLPATWASKVSDKVVQEIAIELGYLDERGEVTDIGKRFAEIT